MYKPAKAATCNNHVHLILVRWGEVYTRNKYTEGLKNNQAKEMLGVYLSPDGNNNEQFDALTLQKMGFIINP